MKNKKYWFVGIYAAVVFFVLLMPLFSGYLIQHGFSINFFSGQKEVDTFTRSYILNIKNNDFNKVIESSTSGVKVDQTTISQMSKLLSDVEIVNGQLIRWEYLARSGDSPRYNLFYEFKNNKADRYLYVSSSINQVDDNFELSGINFQSTDKSVFDFFNNLKYIWPNLLLSILIGVFMIWSALHYIKYSPKSNWIILLLILLLMLTYKSGGVFSSIELPLGALAYWMFRKKIFNMEKRKIS